jgi:anti-sigma-K factor RskA
MMALSKKMLEQEPGEIEALLPWHAAGTLNARDARRVEEALARDGELAKQYAVIREEYAETIGLNETLGAPSARAMQKLFAAIDAEPVRQPSSWSRLSTRVSGFFASLSPRTLAWSASLGALALVLQAAVIGGVLIKNQQGSTFQTASLSMNEPTTMTRTLSGNEASPPQALVRFAPDTKISDIMALLSDYQASIIDARGGLFRLQFGDRAMSKEDTSALIRKLGDEKIVNLAVAAR